MTGPEPGVSERGGLRDIVAGISVSLVLIPQAMAYAELAGLSSAHGLYAAAVAPVAAAFFASSPYLQTGPTALTALLTLGALLPLAATGSAEYAALAALLALIVGGVRVLVGMFGAGWISYIMSRPMLDGFTSGAAVLIVATQLPGAVGLVTPDVGVLPGLWWTVTNLGSWEPAALVLTGSTVALILGGRRFHPLVPGVLIAAALALIFSILTGYDGPTIGVMDSGIPAIALDLPWRAVPGLLIAGVVIAFVGFAEASAIARLYAGQDRMAWSPDREFLSQGAANLAAGLVSGLPVGGSFGRSALNRISGARTRWSGAVTGLAVLAFLPFTSVLSALPRAVLSAIVIAAVASLIRVPDMVRVWRLSRAQGFVTWTTFTLTLALAPRIELAVLFGVLAAVGVHIWREMRPGVKTWSEGDEVHLEPSGVLWFGSAQFLERALLEGLHEARDAHRLIIHLGGLGRIDLSGALVLQDVLDRAAGLGLEVELADEPSHAHRILDSVLDSRKQVGIVERSSG
ncbi:MAG: SulP family inorganic anion transporter [Gemmatimonadota bacterium]|nr:MAG: SulP family inorganic anion transporter [Gemmatimonadota bacterium]